MKNFISMATVAILVFSTNYGFSQNIVLVNGQATEVVLDGNDIKEIVKQKITNYMKEYGQEVDEEFMKAKLMFDSNINTIHSESQSSISSLSTKSMAIVPDDKAYSSFKIK